MAGEFIVTHEWQGENGDINYTYTLDGKLIAVLDPVEDSYRYAYPFGDYVMVNSADVTLICDREFNTLFEFLREGSNSYFVRGPNVLYRSDSKTLVHRTYLPDGTRLVTWYDPDMA